MKEKTSYLFLAFLELANFAFRNSNNAIYVLIGQILFLLILPVFSMKLGLKSLIFLTLISYGKWVYIGDNISGSFLTTKFAGISIVLYLFVLYIIPYLLRVRYDKIFIIFSVLLLIWSIFLLANSSVYLDNFIADFKTLVFVFVFLAVAQVLSSKEIWDLVIAGIDISLVMLLGSSIFRLRFEYGLGHEYLPINSLSFFLPIFIVSPILNIGNVGLARRILWSVSSLFILLTDDVFISGKFLALTVLALILLILKPKKRFVSFVSVLIMVIALPLVKVIDPVSTYKIEQVTSLSNVSKYSLIMSSHTSAGNIISEFDNIFKQPNKFYLLVGKGLGGGISDLNGHLIQFAGTGGYSPLDKLRDNYFKMHLPASEIIVKFGILGFLFYSVFLSRYLLGNIIGIEGVLLVACLLTVFYISKEYLLLSALLYITLKNKDAESSLFK